MKVALLDLAGNSFQMIWRRTLVDHLRHAGHELLIVPGLDTRFCNCVLDLCRKAHELWADVDEPVGFITYEGFPVGPWADEMSSVLSDASVGCVAASHGHLRSPQENNPIVEVGSAAWQEMQFVAYPDSPDPCLWAVVPARLKRHGFTLLDLDWAGIEAAKRDEEPRHESTRNPTWPRVYGRMLDAGLETIYCPGSIHPEAPFVRYTVPCVPLPREESWIYHMYSIYGRSSAIIQHLNVRVTARSANQATLEWLDARRKELYGREGTETAPLVQPDQHVAAVPEAVRGKVRERHQDSAGGAPRTE